jgi:glycine cleavage system H protein
MSTLLALVSAIILILVGGLRRRTSAVPVFAPRYFHPGHTWMQMTRYGEVVVGVDSFVATMLAHVDSVKLPRYLRKLHQGAAAIEVKFGSRTMKLVSPVSGRVIEKNEMVLQNPALLLTSPLRDGWLFKVHPENVASQTRNLFTGTWATYLQEMTRTQLTRLFAGTPVLTAQDGGWIIKGIAERCSDAEWRAIRGDFFLDTD